MRAAVFGIGSNSVRMLVAEAADGEIRRISRDRADHDHCFLRYD